VTEAVRESLRDRFSELAEQRGIDVSDATASPSSRGYLRLNAPGVEAVEVWGNSGVRDFLDRLEGERGDSDDAIRNAEEGRAADRREDIEFIQSLPVANGAEAPDPEDFAALASIDPETDQLFVSVVNDRKTLSAYETADRNDRLGSVTIDPTDTPNAATRLLNALQDLGPETAREAAAGGVTLDEELAENAADRQTRRELRNSLDSALEAEGYDADRWNTDARADGTLILQDPETNRTRTIEAGDDLDSTVDSFGGDSDVQPESDDGGSGEQGGDGLDRRAIGAGLIVAAAAAYGVLQK